MNEDYDKKEIDKEMILLRNNGYNESGNYYWIPGAINQKWIV